MIGLVSFRLEVRNDSGRSEKFSIEMMSTISFGVAPVETTIEGIRGSPKSIKGVDQSGQDASFAFHHRGAVTALTAPEPGIEQVSYCIAEHV